MSGCDKYQELISRMIDGELDQAESAALKDHIDTCPDCARLYNAFAALSSAISQDLEEPPQELHENIMAGVRRQTLRRGLWSRLPKQYRSLLAAAACIALIAGFSWCAENLMPRAGSSAPMSGGGANDAAAPAAYSASAAQVTEESALEDRSTADSGAAMTIDLPAEAPMEAPAPEPNGLPEAEEDGAALPIPVAGGDVWQELIDLLSGEPAGGLPDGAAHLYTFTGPGAGQQVTVWELDGGLYWLESPDGALSAAACTPQELETFLADMGIS